METERRDGTGPQPFIDGAAKFFAERDQHLVQIEFRGWRAVDKKFNPAKLRPTHEWIASSVAGSRTAACANIGWYTHDKSTDTFTRHGGHWMTVTGAATHDGEFAIDLHDPAPRSGKGNVTHHAHLDRISSGKLVGGRNDLPADAAGLYVLRDGIVPKEVVKGEKTWPIIDGIVVFTLE
jgi:hypothetical protein